MVYAALAALFAALPISFDDDLTISLLRNAYESHMDRCKSGRMHFTWSNQFVPGEDLFQLKGLVEWSEDYMYFDGNMQHAKSGSRGRTALDHDIRLLFSGGYELKRSSSTERNAVSFISYDITPGQHDKAAAWRPDPVTYLVLTGPYEGTNNPLSLLQPQPTTLRFGRLFERSVETRNRLVELNTTFPSDTAKRIFDLDQAGLCTEMHLVWHKDTGDSYIHATREWKCVNDDLWFPSRSKMISSHDQAGSDPVRIVECVVDSFEPLTKRAFSGPARLSSFGPVPKGAMVSEQLADGTIREWTEGVDGASDLERALQEHVKRIRPGSFMDPR
ncbi:MAG: hypothetical protein ACK58L_19415 [Planctomycetota bacterium]